MSSKLTSAVILPWVMLVAASVPLSAAAQTPEGVATFESIGITWGPPEASSTNVCLARYREPGNAWREGYPLVFDEKALEYRGSLVKLSPDTAYEVELTLKHTGTQETFTLKTWSETFPVAKTVVLSEFSNETLKITESGSPDGYVLYTAPSGKTSTIDGERRRDFNVAIDASYVIVRGLILKNAEKNSIRLHQGAHDVVIEENEMTGWGRLGELGWGSDDGAIHGSETTIARIIVQRNLIHHPAADTNSWCERRPDAAVSSSGTHPKGPYAIYLFNTAGNHVIRYNTVYSDEHHYLSDIFGGGSNISREGFPNRDSDIYGNFLSHAWDDGIESEGGNRNVRIWENYIERVYNGVATRPTSVGPIYIWRNVLGSSRMCPQASPDEDVRGEFHKAGQGSCSDCSDLGVFVFHNTVLQPAESGLRYPIGANGGAVGRMVNTTTRNNIFQVAMPDSGYSIKGGHSPSGSRNDYDYDLYNGQFRNLANEHEMHGISGTPVYNPVVTLDPVQGRGIFVLDPLSPGYDSGVRLPNFNDEFTGQAPDMGAHEAGTPPMEFGIHAYRDGRKSTTQRP
ncbi:MAG TPA: hypothetical protein VLK65_04365 [Vicinamibacteria bacterium]|nr:hypothetical protein [Vicinamibacteria bacterium]